LLLQTGFLCIFTSNDRRIYTNFVSEPFKFDPKKATPGSLKIFSVNPNRPAIEDDNDWEKFVHGAPKYGPVEEDSEEESEHEEIGTEKSAEGNLFKVPDIFSDVTSSSEGFQGDFMTSQDMMKSRDVMTSHEVQRVRDEDSIWSSSSSSDDNVNVIMPEVPVVLCRSSVCII
jgi:hypothetical protein